MNNTDLPIKMIRPNDLKALQTLAIQMAEPKMAEWFWEDSLRANPLLSFFALFGNGNNLILDIADGQGVMAFTSIIPGWRASLYVAGWGPDVQKNPAIAQKALGVAMEIHDLLVVEAITRSDNVASQKAMQLAGFTYKGLIPDRLCYNGKRIPGAWWEISREDIGLEGRKDSRWE